jgi:hypothetical protein
MNLIIYDRHTNGFHQWIPSMDPMEPWNSGEGLKRRPRLQVIKVIGYTSLLFIRNHKILG